MTATLAAASRRLPRGWAHLGLQFGLWIGFYFAYQAARGLADRGGDATAFANGEWVIDFQRRLGAMFELTLQRAVDSSGFLIQATSVTYWLSQFAVVGLALIWVYFRAHERFFRFRNTLIAGNLIGLLFYVIVPTAPPRMFPGAGFTDTLAAHSTREPLVDVRRLRGEPVRGDAEPARARRADRERRDGDGRAQSLGEDPLARVGAVGLVLA